MMHRWNLPLFLMLLMGLCTSCSSFHSRWKAAATSATEQRWEGKWTSEKHHAPMGGPEEGRLRAVTEPAPKGGLTAHFHAHWLIFASDYSTTFQPKPGPRRNGVREFSGTQDLPKLFGGTYHYETTWAGDQLTTHYKSSYDYGTFSLHRVNR
jgi:hypothetical protein